MRRVTVVDYGRGNLFSLGRALDQIGAEHHVSDDPATVAAAECLILPGVGAFGDAMAGLARRDLVDPLRRAAADGTPILGICLGMQIMVSRGEEFGSHEGLDFIPGTVRRLAEGDGGPEAIRIPNVGWRAVHATHDDALLRDVPNGSMFYFVHSYALVLDNPQHAIATTSVNGSDVPAIIRSGSIVGCQFHPEKSGRTGVKLIGQFLKFAETARSAA